MSQEDRPSRGMGTFRRVVDIALRQRESDLGRASDGFQHRDYGILRGLAILQ